MRTDELTSRSNSSQLLQAGSRIRTRRPDGDVRGGRMALTMGEELHLHSQCAGCSMPGAAAFLADRTIEISYFFRRGSGWTFRMLTTHAASKPGHVPPF